jgi:hypothetical protein
MAKNTTSPYIGSRKPVWDGTRWVPNPDGPLTLADVNGEKKEKKNG